MNNKISIRSFQQYDKKFRLILKTFGEEDIKFAYMLSFPFYFWYHEIATSTERINKTWEDITENIPLRKAVDIQFIRDKESDYKTINRYSSLYELLSSTSTHLPGNTSYTFDGFSLSNKDKIISVNIENWCKEKINFLKYIE